MKYLEIAEAFDLNRFGFFQIDGVAEAIDFLFDLGFVDGFEDVSRSADLIGFKRVILIGGHEDDVDRWVFAFELFGQLNAVESRHGDV